MVPDFKSNLLSLFEKNYIHNSIYNLYPLTLAANQNTDGIREMPITDEIGIPLINGLLDKTHSIS